MALEIDGLAVLCAIAEAPEAFPAIRSDVTKAAHALVTKQLKAKTLDLAGLRAVREALGPQPLALIVDGLKDAEVKALVTRLDKHHPDLKDGPAVLHRRHLMAIAADLDPVGAPARNRRRGPGGRPRACQGANEGEARRRQGGSGDGGRGGARGGPGAAERPAPPARPARGKTAPADALASAAMAARPPRRPRQQE